MADEDFEGLRQRTMIRHRLEREHGTYLGRNRTPPVGLAGYYGGAFGECIRTAWSEILGSTGLPDGHPLKLLEADARDHVIRGVDVAVMFWTDDAEEKADRVKVAQYLAREAGKWRQNQPPPGFIRVGRYYGVWGRKVGFVPQVTATSLDIAVGAEVEARLSSWVNWRMHVSRGDEPAPARRETPRQLWGDDVTALGLDAAAAARIVAWSEKAAARKRARREAPEGDGGAADGDLLALLRQDNLLTGELPPPDPASEIEPQEAAPLSGHQVDTSGEEPCLD